MYVSQQYVDTQYKGRGRLSVSVAADGDTRAHGAALEARRQKRVCTQSSPLERDFQWRFFSLGRMIND